MEQQKRPRESLDKGRCLSFINKLWEADHLAMFHHPVSATEVPSYYEMISSPTDLSTIKKNIEEDKYSSDADVQDDVALMISNALEFNEKGTEWYDMARRMRKDYLRMAAESGLAVDADAAFIPAKKARDDESTLRKAEAKYGEQFDDVLGELEREKEIPLEELRKKYSRSALVTKDEDDGDGSDDSASGSASEDDEDSDESSGSDSEDDSASDDSSDDEDSEE